MRKWERKQSPAPSYLAVVKRDTIVHRAMICVLHGAKVLDAGLELALLLQVGLGPPQE